MTLSVDEVLQSVQAIEGTTIDIEASEGLSVVQTTSKILISIFRPVCDLTTHSFGDSPPEGVPWDAQVLPAPVHGPL